MSGYVKYHKCHHCGYEWKYWDAWRLPMFEWFCPKCGTMRKEKEDE